MDEASGAVPLLRSVSLIGLHLQSGYCCVFPNDQYVLRKSSQRSVPNIDVCPHAWIAYLVFNINLRYCAQPFHGLLKWCCRFADYNRGPGNEQKYANRYKTHTLSSRFLFISFAIIYSNGRSYTFFAIVFSLTSNIVFDVTSYIASYVPPSSPVTLPPTASLTESPTSLPTTPPKKPPTSTPPPPLAPHKTALYPGPVSSKQDSRDALKRGDDFSADSTIRNKAINYPQTSGKSYALLVIWADIWCRHDDPSVNFG